MKIAYELNVGIVGTEQRVFFKIQSVGSRNLPVFNRSKS
jgi:hypothetical protein